MGYHDHTHDLPRNLGFAVLTVSDTRTPETDVSGKVLVERIEKSGHRVVARDILKDDVFLIREKVARLIAMGGVDVVVCTGGTGVSPGDVTVEAVLPLLDRVLPGFGEMFRRESEKEIDTGAMLTRALCGTSAGVVIFCMPGSPGAAKTGARLMLSEVAHMVKEARKGRRIAWLDKHF